MIYNTAIANRLVSKIHDLSTGEYQVIDCPIDAVYHDGQRSLASSFSYECLERCMPGYGYPYRDGGKLDDPAPKDSGLFLVDLKENTSELLISLSELAQMEDESYRQGYMAFCNPFGVLERRSVSFFLIPENTNRWGLYEAAYQRS